MAEEAAFPSLRSELPAALGTPPDVLYHYTTREGLLGILSSHSLWATSIRHLSDTSEFTYSLTVLKGVVEARLSGSEGAERGLLETFQKVANMATFPVTGFVFSMSEHGDLLSQWRAYGQPGNSYAIGFDAHGLRRLLDSRGYFLARCRYDLEEQEALIHSVVDAAIARYHKRSSGPNADADLSRRGSGVDFGVLILQAGTLLKSPAFREEQEWRLVRSGPEARLDFRAGASMIVPYQTIDLGNDPQTLPFREIVVGPSPHPTEDESAANLLSHHMPTSELEVVRSTIPFRAW